MIFRMSRSRLFRPEASGAAGNSGHARPARHKPDEPAARGVPDEPDEPDPPALRRNFPRGRKFRSRLKRPPASPRRLPDEPEIPALPARQRQTKADGARMGSFGMRPPATICRKQTVRFRPCAGCARTPLSCRSRTAGPDAPEAGARKAQRGTFGLVSGHQGKPEPPVPPRSNRIRRSKNFAQN